MIKKYKSNIREFGYNISNGGNHHKGITEKQRQAIIENNKTRVLSEETKEKLRQKFQGENGYWYGVTNERMKGKPLSQLALDRAAQYHKENPMPQETRDKISKTLKENPYWLGKKMSEESKQKMSQSRKGKFKGGNNPMARAVVQIDKETNELIRVFDCAQDVENELGINRTSITTCCRGGYKTAGGYVWKYKDEIEGLAI